MLVSLVSTHEMLDGAPRKRRRLDAPQPRQRLSTFECLPLEVLEHIFVESKNVRLLRASHRLAWLLSSRHVRKQLITRCFRSDGLIQDVDNDLPEYELAYKHQCQGISVPDPETYHEAFTDLSLLLREEWVTMSLVKEAVLDWILKAASYELRRFIAQYMHSSDLEAEFSAAMVQLRRVLNKSTSPMTPADIKFFADDLEKFGAACEWCNGRLAKSDDWVFTYPSTRAPVLLRMAFLEDPWRGKTALGWMRIGTIQRTPNSQIPASADPDLDAPVAISRSTHSIVKFREGSFIPWTACYQLIPPRLLAGPWTQDRGDLLKFLWDHCASQYLDDEGFSPAQLRAAVVGVDAALNENNQMAAYMLLNSYGSSCPALKPANILGNDLLGCTAPRVTNPWTTLSGVQMPARGLGIPALPLTTEHLRRAVDGFDRHPGISMLLIGHLTHPDARIPVLPERFVWKLKAIADRTDPQDGEGREQMILWLKNARRAFELYRQYDEKGANTGSNCRVRGFCD